MGTPHPLAPAPGPDRATGGLYPSATLRGPLVALLGPGAPVSLLRSLGLLQGGKPPWTPNATLTTPKATLWDCRDGVEPCNPNVRHSGTVRMGTPHPLAPAPGPDRATGGLYPSATLRGPLVALLGPGAPVSLLRSLGLLQGGKPPWTPTCVICRGYPNNP